VTGSVCACAPGLLVAGRDDRGIAEAFLSVGSVEVALRDGRRVLIRSVTRSDACLIQQGFDRLSPESRRNRFLMPVTRLTDQAVASLVTLDRESSDAVGALSLDEPGHPGVGIARYARVPGSPDVAEAAVTVLDDYQSVRLGTALGVVLASLAGRRGISRLRAHVLADNRRVLALLDRWGASLHVDSPGVAVAEIDLDTFAAI